MAHTQIPSLALLKQAGVGAGRRGWLLGSPKKRRGGQGQVRRIEDGRRGVQRWQRRGRRAGAGAVFRPRSPGNSCGPPESPGGRRARSPRSCGGDSCSGHAVVP